MDIGDKIRKVREARGLTQKEVALAIDMDQSQYSKIEKGKTDPSTSTLEKNLGLPIMNLFCNVQWAEGKHV